MIRTYYHLVLVVGVWLLKKLKIYENLSGFQSSATIFMYGVGQANPAPPKLENLPCSTTYI